MRRKEITKWYNLRFVKIQIISSLLLTSDQVIVSLVSLFVYIWNTCGLEKKVIALLGVVVGREILFIKTIDIFIVCVLDSDCYSVTKLDEFQMISQIWNENYRDFLVLIAVGRTGELYFMRTRISLHFNSKMQKRYKRYNYFLKFTFNT